MKKRKETITTLRAISTLARKKTLPYSLLETDRNAGKPNETGRVRGAVLVVVGNNE